MKNRLSFLASILLIFLPAGAMCELQEMNDIELKYITGTEGFGPGEFMAGMNNSQTEKNVNVAFHEQFLPGLSENEHADAFHTEFLRGMDQGTIEFKNMAQTEEGASFDIFFDGFESDTMANTGSIGFNKQHRNHHTVIDGWINHLTRN